MNQVNKIVESKSRRVSCRGNNGALGHPLIYLDFGPDKTELECPYCSKKFLLKK